MSVFIELSPGETLVIGNSRVKLQHKSGQRARLMIDSTEDIERVKAGDALPAMKPPTTAPAKQVEPSPIPFLRRPAPAAT